MALVVPAAARREFVDISLVDTGQRFVKQTRLECWYNIRTESLFNCSRDQTNSFEGF